MFTERKLQTILLAAEERNAADLVYLSRQTLRSAGAQLVGFIAVSINIRLLWSYRVIGCGLIRAT